MSLFKRVVGVSLAALMAVSAFATTAFAVDDPLKDTTRDVTFTIHKYDVPAEDQTVFPEGNGTELAIAPDYDGLEGVTFTAYKIADGARGTAVPSGATAAFTMTTNAAGEATTTVAAANQGTYLFVETAKPTKVTQSTPNFVVDLPMTNPDKTTWNYNVHVYPKNYTVLGAVILTKTADGAAMPAGKTATFKLQKYDNTSSAWLNQRTGLVTDANGKIVMNDLTVGNYQFVETAAPEGYGLNTTPVTFSITANGKVTGSTYVKTGTVPEVTLDNSSTPTIHKAVSTDGTNYGQDAGQDTSSAVYWKITPSVPNDIATYQKFVVTDVIDSKLTFSGLNTVVVKIGETTLTEGTDYLATYENGTLTVAFINGTFEGGKAALAGKTGLSIVFETTINNTAVMGEEIPNQATLSYKNASATAADPDTEEHSEIPEVHTGGVKFVKVDSANTDTKLQGAEFTIYATKADAESDTNAIMTAVSGANGYFEFKGLAYGDLNDTNVNASRTYYIVETKAPEGYQLVGTVKAVIVNSTSYADTSRIEITNVLKPDLPLTGGAGTTMFLVAGLLLIGCAAFMYRKYRKSAKA